MPPSVIRCCPWNYQDACHVVPGNGQPPATPLWRTPHGLATDGWEVSETRTGRGGVAISPTSGSEVWRVVYRKMLHGEDKKRRIGTSAGLEGKERSRGHSPSDAGLYRMARGLAFSVSRRRRRRRLPIDLASG